MKTKLLGLYLFLEQIKSPLLDPVHGQALTALDLFRGLYAVKHPAADCLGLWAEGPAIYDAAVIGWAGTIEPEELPSLVEGMIGELGPQVVRTQAVLAPLLALGQQPGKDQPGPGTGAANNQQPGASAGTADRKLADQTAGTGPHDQQQQ